MLPDSEMQTTPATITVVVLFRPEAGDLANLAQMASWSHDIIAVVNACDEVLSSRLPTSESIYYIRNRANLGLAHALNQGLTAAIAQNADYVLLLDQDSRPAEPMREQLVMLAANLQAAGHRLACLAPTLIDCKLSSANVGSSSPDRAISGTLATSGTLITRVAWENVGPMWRELFVDGIDHEWCFRARGLGFETLISPNITMPHDMGESAIAFFGRFKPIHRSAARHYFIVRNTFWLARRHHIPLRWRISEVLKLAYRAPAYFFFSNNRALTTRNIIRALADGLFRKPHMVSSSRFQ